MVTVIVTHLVEAAYGQLLPRRVERIYGRSVEAIARARFGQDVVVRDGQIWARRGRGPLQPICEIREVKDSANA